MKKKLAAFACAGLTLVLLSLDAGAKVTTATLSGTDTVEGAKLGFPFPIPGSGAEAIWNHKLKWRGENVRRSNDQLIVQPNGEFQLTKIVEDVKFYYASIKNPQPLS